MRPLKCLLMHTLMAACIAAAELPNVVMIMADDWGWSDIAAYRRFQGLSDPIPTPNLDRMCANGMMFTDAHSPAALCAPTRFSMMTGSNPYRNGVQWGTWKFTATSAFSNGRKHVTVGEIAKTGGYRTAFLGKMHLGGGVAEYETVMPNFPTTYGFDYAFVTHAGIQNAPYLYFENDRFVKIDPADPLNPSVPGFNADLKNWAVGSHSGANGVGFIQDFKDKLGDVNWNSSQNGIINSKKAAAFVRGHVAANPDQPFMMYYSPPQVHVPHTPPIDFEPNADGTPGSPPNVPVAGATGGSDVADIIYELDLQVGRILNSLDDPNGDGDFSDSIITNTLIMFTSDNGGLSTDRDLPEEYDSTGVLRGWKADSYEGGHRVPFVAMWPGMIASNSVSDQLICGHDWVGMMYALTTNSMPSDQAMDCVNLLPTLLGEQSESEPLREFLILQGHSVQNSDNSYIMRQGDYVLLMDDDRIPVELYNLAMDFTQETNLIAEASEQTRIAEMETLFKQHDQKNDARSTPAYQAPVDVYPPTPNPAGFSSAPSALNASSVTMTAETGTDVSAPVEYYFTEHSGHEGGDDSGWQTSTVYVDSGLLPGLTYAYSVQMRDASNQVGTASAVLPVTISNSVALLFDDFETGPNPASYSAAPYPTGVWHMQNALGNGWSVEAQDSSVVIDDINGDSNNEMQLGWGYDEVAVLFSTTTPIDLTKDYKFSGSWEIAALFSPRGFVAGIAEFSSTNGVLVQRITPNSNVFGDTVSPTVGETGSFEVTVTSAQLQSAGVTAGNYIGLFLHHDDDGTLYSESDGFTDKGDVYLIDDVQLSTEVDLVGMFAQWMLNYGVSGPTNDADGDGVVNLVEFALGGNPTNPLVTGGSPGLEAGAGGMKYIYPRRMNSGLEYTVETRTNLLAGTWSTNGTVELTPAGSMNPDFESVTNAVPSAEAELFIRLNIKEP